MPGITERHAVAIDLSRHPEVSWAVVVRGQLLPVRFGQVTQAMGHLEGMLGRKLTEAEARMDG